VELPTGADRFTQNHKAAGGHVAMWLCESAVDRTWGGNVTIDCRVLVTFRSRVRCRVAHVIAVPIGTGSPRKGRRGQLQEEYTLEGGATSLDRVARLQTIRHSAERCSDLPEHRFRSSRCFQQTRACEHNLHRQTDMIQEMLCICIQLTHKPTSPIATGDDRPQLSATECLCGTACT
jgi:hypothetical protein